MSTPRNHLTQPRRGFVAARLATTLVTAAASLLALAPACAPVRPGCLDDASASCVPAAACPALPGDVSCGGLVAAYRVGNAGDRPGGVEALASGNDLVLDNGVVRAVVDAVDHPQHLAVSGGTLIDLAPKDGLDHLDQVSQVVGILPRDQAQYTSVEFAALSPLSASIVARGALYGDSRIRIVTRYELRACESGLRMRTELYNGSRQAQAIYLADAYFWGDRGLSPFVPTAGGGFAYPPLSLLTIEDSFRTFPFMSSQSHSGAVVEGSYAMVACDRKALQGINTTELSAAGTARTVVMPGDGIAFERVFFAAAGAGSAPAQALATAARTAMFQEKYVTVSGHASLDGGKNPSGSERDFSLVFSEGDGANATPWAEAVPAADGSYSVRLPASGHFNAQAYSFGRPVLAPQPLALTGSDITFDMTGVPLPASLVVTVRDTSGADLNAELIMRATGTTAESDVTGTTYGSYGGCAPYLGPAHGGSPACNRVLVFQGRAVFQAPPGEYWIYATHGMDYSMQRQHVVLSAGSQTTLSFALQQLTDIFPKDSLSGDFHVHGGRSFDTGLPDYDRVVSFLAHGIQVIAATDHDVVGSYTAEMSRLGVDKSLFVMPGTELTGLVLFYKRKGSIVPRTLGHFNFWPLVYDPLQARNGTIWDELKEPGALYDLMAQAVGPDGVLQLNHPYAESKLGRDEGYARAIGYDVRKPIPAGADDSPAGTWLKAPLGGRRNIDHQAQEVMNGASLGNFVQYRVLWFSFLRQGFLRAGTANSDSHTLTIEQVGYPRNIVLVQNNFPDVDIPAFNAAVRNGQMIGTNGPYIDAHIVDANGHSQGPSIAPFKPAAGASFHVIVRAAPWVPVEELRVIVNGDLVQSIPMSAMSVPADPFGVSGVVRYEGDIALSSLLSSDGFVLFEAGMKLPLFGDILDENGDPGQDGVADAFDYNGDGVVDAADLKVTDPVFPPRAPESDARYHVDTLSPGMWPTAYTNPFVIDIDGDGWRAPGL